MAARHEQDDRPEDSTEATAVEPVGSRAPTVSDDLVGKELGPYHLTRLLGQGAMGIVYEARERDGAATVALKLLRNADAHAILGLKREFRHLASLRHPNLVELYALHAAEEHEWFIAMQRVDGVAFLDHVWGGPLYGGVDRDVEARVRNALLQLARAVCVLHEHGVLHRDIKPSNVMVEKDGHLRLLDFGLSRGLSRARATPTSSLSGTPAYMAPELFEHAPPSPLQDWFGVGAVLYHALTGRRPFAPQLAQRAASLLESPPPPRSLNHEIPADLSVLAMALIELDPSRRASGDQVFEVLGAMRGARHTARHADVFVGRERELQAMREHLVAARAKSPGWVEIVADTGFGKSTLMQRFIDQAAREPHTILLWGRCFERESVPFQAFDDIAAQLAAYLHQVDPRSRAEVDDDLMEASRVLPVLSSKRPNDDGLSVFERRRRGFIAFKNVLTRLATDNTIVLVIDDTQWVDHDSARLLEELLTLPMPARLLVLTSTRKADEHTSFALSKALTERHLVTRPVSLKLEPLTNEASHRLVQSLSPSLSDEARALVVAESHGVPLFLSELARQDLTGDGPLSITHVIARRLESLSLAEIKTVRLLALFARPMPQKVLAQAAGIEASRPKIIASLRHAGLVRTSGPLATDDVELCHGRIAAIVCDETPSRERALLLESLDRTLTTSPLTTPELRAHFSKLAGRSHEAAAHAIEAARRAEQALAFEQAALWYERALDWHEFHARREELELAWARVLVHAGRSQRAATLFETLARRAPLGDRTELLRLAAEAWFTAGEIERGLATIAPRLAELNVPYPRTSWKTMGQFASELLRLRFSFLSRPAEAVRTTRDREVADACWTVAKGVGLLLPLEGAIYHLRSLRAARAVSDDVRTARVLAVFSPTLGALGLFSELSGAMAREARGIAEQRSDRYLLGLCDVASAIDETVRGGRPEKVDSLARRGLVHLTDSGLPVTWETDLARCLFLIASYQLGRLRQVEREAGIWLAEASDRGDVYAQILAHHMLAYVMIAHGNVEATREHANAPIRRWSYERYTVPHYFAARFTIQAALSGGDCRMAEALLNEEWPRFERAQLLRYENPGLDISYLRAIVTQHLAFESSSARVDKSSLLRLVAKLRMTKKPLFEGHASMVTASIHAREGKTKKAISDLDLAVLSYGRAGQVLAAKCAERRLFELSRREEGLKEVDRWMADVGISDPSAFVATQAPPVRERKRA